MSELHFVGDALSGHEFNASRLGGSSVYQVPEHRLMFEILIDAVRLVTGTRIAAGNCGKRDREEASDWIGDDGGGLFGYGSICEVLGVNKDVLRAGIAEWIRGRDAGEEVGWIAKRSPAESALRRMSVQRYAKTYRRRRSLA